MTHHNTLTVKFSNLQLNKLKSGRKNGTEVTLNRLSNLIDNSCDEANFQHNLLLTITQVSRLFKALVNHSSDNIRLPKTRLHKIGQSGGFLGRLSGPLLKTGLPLMKNALKPLAKSLLIPLGLTAAASATDAVIQKKIFRSVMMTIVVSNEEMDDTMKIIKSLEESGLLIKKR